MKNLIVILFLFSINTSLSQILFYQDILNGGITAAGFSTSGGSGSGSFDIYIEPGSSIKKAYLFQYRNNFPPEIQPFYLNGVEFSADTLNRISRIYSDNPLANPEDVFYWDVTNELDPSILTYNIDMPLLPPPQQPEQAYYRAIYLVVCYENAALPEVAVNLSSK
jgi:hypothetical protein